MDNTCACPHTLTRKVTAQILEIWQFIFGKVVEEFGNIVKGVCAITVFAYMHKQ